MWEALASFDFSSSRADVAHHLQFLHQGLVFVNIQKDGCALPMLGEDEGPLCSSHLI
jgi:hypothetical protein